MLILGSIVVSIPDCHEVAKRMQHGVDWTLQFERSESKIYPESLENKRHIGLPKKWRAIDRLWRGI